MNLIIRIILQDKFQHEIEGVFLEKVLHLLMKYQNVCSSRYLIRSNVCNLPLVFADNYYQYTLAMRQKVLYCLTMRTIYVRKLNYE